MLKDRDKEHLELLEEVWFVPFDNLLVFEIDNFKINRKGFLEVDEKQGEVYITSQDTIRKCNIHPFIDDEHKKIFLNEIIYLALKENKKAIKYFHSTYCLIDLIVNGAKLEIIEPYIEDRLGIVYSQEIKRCLKKYYSNSH